MQPPVTIKPSRTVQPTLSYQDKVKRGIISSLRNKSQQQRQAFSLDKLKEMKSRGLNKSRPMIGGLYLYAYDAKYKEELEYWDAFPLIMPIEYYDNGWLGINFHYLHPMIRARLMDAIESVAAKTGKNERAKLKVSYDMLKGVSKAKIMAPAIKRYLAGQTRSKLLEVAKSDWDLALSLPLARWQKASASKVYSDSRKY
jgi:hypothetical protein